MAVQMLGHVTCCHSYTWCTFPVWKSQKLWRNTAVGRTETIEYVGQREFDAAYIPKAITWVVGLLEGVGGVIFIFTAETLR